eukprot:1162131-Pelagomonas_calceolata.AAC.5
MSQPQKQQQLQQLKGGRAFIWLRRRGTSAKARACAHVLAFCFTCCAACVPDTPGTSLFRALMCD